MVCSTLATLSIGSATVLKANASRAGCEYRATRGGGARTTVRGIKEFIAFIPTVHPAPCKQVSHLHYHPLDIMALRRSAEFIVSLACAC